MKNKLGRNDPCPCGSGKKFKKCCDKKMIGGRFMANRIGGVTSNSTTSKLSSFFQSNLSSIKPLGESGRTFTVQRGAPAKKAPSQETTTEEATPLSEEKTSEEDSSEIIEPKGEEEKPPEENNEAHS